MSASVVVTVPTVTDPSAFADLVSINDEEDKAIADGALLAAAVATTSAIPSPFASVAVAKATEVGMGIASLPDWMEFEMIALTEVLSQLKGPEMSISLCFKTELRNDPRIKAFKDFMIKEAEVIN